MPRKSGETNEEYYEREISELTETGARYERALRAIKSCPLVSPDFGDWVQVLCEEVLDGREGECWNCETPVHDGPCVGEGD